jgi:hypothetical protein
MTDNTWAELVKSYEDAERKRLDDYMLRTQTNENS